LRKSYGQVFLKSLPPMTRTRSLDQVKRFFDEAAPVVSAEAAIN
jgi:hypothetical protein